jgi:hypothetical protein
MLSLRLIVTTPLVALLPLLVLSTSTASCLQNASPLVGLLFASWLSCHPCCHATAASCPFSMLPPPLVIHTGWLLHLVLSCCFRLPPSHQHHRLLMRWLLISHPHCLSFAPTGCLCVWPGMPYKSVHGYMSVICPNISIQPGGGVDIRYVHMQKNAK